MRYREVFTVYPRRLPSGLVVFYYQTYDEAGKRTSAKSTGARTARDVRMYCMKLLKAGLLGVTVKKIPTMGEFSRGWWNLDTCEYLKSRMARRKISTSYARQGTRILTKYILPAFKSKRLDEISSHAIDAWMLANREKGIAPKSVNLMLSILQVMLGFAVKKGVLKANPCDQVERLTVERKKIEILRPEEVKKLFEPGTAIKLWTNEINYLINSVGATTGLRIGEILGLKGNYLFPDYLEVARQYNGFREYTETKTHDTRYVPIPEMVSRGLARLKEINGEGFIFSLDGGKTPVSRSIVYRYYQRALARIGIDREEQKRRVLSFHKWRHFFNTTLRMGNVADGKVRELTGHKSESMTNLYTHFDTRKFGDVKRIQEEIITGTTEKESERKTEKKKTRRKNAA